MKKMIFALLLGISFLSTNAYAYGYSALNLKLYDNSYFTVQFDDVVYNEPVNVFTIQDIESGTHFLKVIKNGPLLYGGYSQQLVVFEGYIYLKPGKHIFAFIDKFNRYKVIKQLPYNYNGNVNNQYPPNYYQYPMSNSDFAELKQVIDNTTFESSKIKIAEQAIASNYFLAEQIFELMGLFTFESSKIHIAKLAYHHTLNKSKYYIVNNAFTFESSIDELNQYILSH